MKIASFILAACAFVSVLGPVSRADGPISLEDAVGFALQSNRNLRVLSMSISSAELSLKGARADFTVGVTPMGAADTSDDSETVEWGVALDRRTTLGTSLSAAGEMGRDEVGTADPVHRARVSVEVQQPLLRNFGPLVNRESVTRAEVRVAAARRELELRRTDLVVQVVDGYEALLRLQKQAEFDGQSVTRLDRLIRLTRAREAQGRATRVDMLRVEQQRGDQQIRLEKTLEALSSARADFADLLGFEPSVVFEAVACPVLDIDIPEQRAAEALALSNRLDYAQVLQDYTDARRGVRIARRNLLPDLKLISRYERYGSGESTSEAASLDDESWFVGLTAASDLMLREERVAVGQARIDVDAAEETVRIVESGIRRQVQQVILSYRRMRSEVQGSERNYQLAQNRAMLARRMFEMGRGDNFTASDAEDALFEAQNRMLTSQAEASVAAYRLLRAIGTLLEYPADLKPEAVKDRPPESS